jgi:Protein of unknown function (DUF2567)
VSSLPPVPAGPPRDDAGGAFTLRSPGAIPAAARWRGRAELRADLRSAAAVAGALLLAGLPAGVLWWWLAPRADFRITADGPAAIGQPSQELSVADDSVFVLILAGLGLLAGVLAWRLRRRRGVAVVVALALGAAAAAVVAWQLGELLGAGPTPAQLHDVGARVTTSLTLGSVPALATAPFAALLAYVVGALHAPGEDLGRTESGAATATRTPDESPAVADAPPLVDVPPDR